MYNLIDSSLHQSTVSEQRMVPSSVIPGNQFLDVLMGKVDPGSKDALSRLQELEDKLKKEREEKETDKGWKAVEEKKVCLDLIDDICSGNCFD